MYGERYLTIYYYNVDGETLAMRCSKSAWSGRRFVSHRLLSVLNLSQASFKVLNTAALIMRCSVLASCGICRGNISSSSPAKSQTHTTYLVGMHLANGLHVYNLDLVRHDQITHANLLPSGTFPEHSVHALQQSA